MESSVTSSSGRRGGTEKPSIAITGGGTAGHVFPGLAVAEELSRCWNGRLFWIGSKGGMEKDLVEKAGMPFFSIPAGKLRRYLSLRNITDMARVGAGIMAAYRILRRERPAALFSKGGYVSVPPVIAASLLHIPCFTHDSDFDPGLATRINARFCREIYVSVDRSLEYLPPAQRAKAVVTGNPVRSQILMGSAREGRRIVGCPDSKPLLLVIGGSSGSTAVNALVEGALPRILSSCFVVHQVGGKSALPQRREGYHPAAFFTEELPHLLAAADLVVSRAGAGFLSELAALGKPSILIPLDAASRGDQVRNAEVFRSAGAAVVMPEAGAVPAELAEQVCALLKEPGRLSDMGRKARAMAKGNPAAEIARRILSAAAGPAAAAAPSGAEPSGV